MDAATCAHNSVQADHANKTTPTEKRWMARKTSCRVSLKNGGRILPLNTGLNNDTQHVGAGFQRIQTDATKRGMKQSKYIKFISILDRSLGPSYRSRPTQRRARLASAKERPMGGQDGDGSFQLRHLLHFTTPTTTR